MKLFHVLMLSFFAVPALAGGHYSLQYSDVFQNCSFIPQDDYSFSAIASSIKSQLETKLEGDRRCNAAFNQMHSSMLNIEKLLGKDLDRKTAEEIYNETYSKYLMDLTQETLTLDPNSARYATLTSQVDSLKLSLLENQFKLQLNKENFSTDKSVDFRRDLYTYSSGLFSSMNSTPPECIDKLGGWDTMLPAVLRVGGMIGSFLAPGVPVLGFGLDAASQLAQLLQSADIKKAISNIERRRNEGILACTYLSLQGTACELQRADKFAQNSAKIRDILMNKFPEGQNGEYEKFYKVMSLLPGISDILRSIGKMGSAVTLDNDLIYAYWAALRIDPDSIPAAPLNQLPGESSEAFETRQKLWLLDLKGRGIAGPTNDNSGQPIPMSNQVQNALEMIRGTKSNIEAVTSILTDTRSFIDLHEELIKKRMNIAKEINFLYRYLKDFSELPDLPGQYAGTFAIALRMTEALQNFLSINLIDGETLTSYEERVNVSGNRLFTEMSKGSISQVTRQTVLMVPEKAYERFTRPFEAIEQFYMNRDIERKDDPEHASYTEFVIYKSLQIKVAKDYPILAGSGRTGRLEVYETTRESFEKGFKSEIKKMIKNALREQSDVLTNFEGQTSAHLCALFNRFLTKYDKGLLKECKRRHTHLDLMDVLGGVTRGKVQMEIEYNRACFYNDYKREENGQRILFERLKDYGNRNLQMLSPR